MDDWLSTQATILPGGTWALTEFYVAHVQSVEYVALIWDWTHSSEDVYKTNQQKWKFFTSNEGNY